MPSAKTAAVTKSADPPTAPMTPRTADVASGTTISATPASSVPTTTAAPAPANTTSWWTEIRNPHFWLGLLAYVPTGWAIFHLPTKSMPVAEAIILGISIVVGPAVSAVLIFVHMKKTTAHESRLQEIEMAAISAYESLIHSGVGGEVQTIMKDLTGTKLAADIRSILAHIHGLKL